MGCAVRVLDLPGSVPPAGTEFLPGSVLDVDLVEKAVHGVDRIVHLAALLGVEQIAAIPTQVLRTNAEGTWNLVCAARKQGVERFVLASSSEVYGNPVSLPIPETAALAPASPYGISKLAAEAYGASSYEQYGLPVVILRYFNVYGPGQSERFVIPIFASRVCHNLPPIIFGHGQQSRCYLYVDDAVAGTALALGVDGIAGEAFNIGSEQSSTVQELAEYLCKLSDNKNLRPEYRPFGKDTRLEKIEIFRRAPDIEKARALLGFDYSVDWKTGVSRVLEHHKSKMLLEGTR
jgi:UDP-glucose 4-epimerase